MRLSVLVKYPTHAVSIQGDSDRNSICCLKYNRSRCDLEQFDWDHLDDLSDFIRKPFPHLVYYVNVDSEDSE